jgi:hypothetical protein
MRCKKQEKRNYKRKERPKNNQGVTFQRKLAKKQSKLRRPKQSNKNK